MEKVNTQAKDYNLGERGREKNRKKKKENIRTRKLDKGEYGKRVKARERNTQRRQNIDFRNVDS